MEAKRITFTLDGPERAALAAFADPGRAEHDALETWAAEHGLAVKASEAGLVRALLLAGVEALRERALDEGYQRLAAELRADEDLRGERRGRRGRRAARDRKAPA